MPYPHKLDEARILDEAARLVDEHGVAALSTRILAEHLHARAPSLYRYFPDKDVLLRSLSARFLADLARDLEPHTTLSDLGNAYWTYAATSPRRYEVITLGACTPGPPTVAEHFPPLEPLMVVAAGFNPHESRLIAQTIGAYLHGAVSLCLYAPIAARPDLEAAFTRGLVALARGLVPPRHDPD